MEQMQLQDNSFRYTVNTPHNALGSLPPTSNGDYNDTVVADELDHPSKRRKVSNTNNTQDTLLKEPGNDTQTDSSYNFFGSFDPNGPSQTATSLPPVPVAEENTGMPQDVETEPLPMGTPPPTIPFSEDPLPQDQEAIVADTTTAEYEVQETVIQQPPSETDTEILRTKKKRGRPKKQDTSEAADSETRIISENVPGGTEQQSTKKKPGRPKKQENDATAEQLSAVEPLKDQNQIMDETNSATATTAKPSKKKKVKRSKTTSDLPNNNNNNKSDEMKAEQDVVWIETNPIDSTTTDENKNNTEQTAAPAEEIKVPKKRGRKKKEVVEEPPAAAAASAENQTVLQDISNIQQQAHHQEKQKDIDIEIDSMKQQVPDAVNASKATNIPETPTVEIQNNQAEGKGVETPMRQEKNKAMKQTPISSAGRVPFRVGLSRRARIAPLLKVVRK